MSDALYQLLDEWKGGSSLGGLCGGGGSPAAGFIARMMAENRLKNKGKYGKSTDLPKGSKMDSPSKFNVNKMNKPSKFVKTHFKESNDKLYTPPNYRSEVPDEPFKLVRTPKGKSAKSVKGGAKHTPAPTSTSNKPVTIYTDQYGGQHITDSRDPDHTYYVAPNGDYYVNGIYAGGAGPPTPPQPDAETRVINIGQNSNGEWNLGFIDGEFIGNIVDVYSTVSDAVEYGSIVADIATATTEEALTSAFTDLGWTILEDVAFGALFAL